MKKRNGVFIGAYVAPEIKEALKQRAAANKITVSSLISTLLRAALHHEPAINTGKYQDRKDFKGEK
jgi:hypothetical protein